MSRVGEMSKMNVSYLVMNASKVKRVCGMSDGSLRAAVRQARHGPYGGKAGVISA